MSNLGNILLIILDIINMAIPAVIASVVAFVIIKYSIISAVKELKKKNIL